MIRQEFELNRWDWKVRVFYEADANDADELYDILQEVGCRGRNLQKAQYALWRGEPNFGITYSNYKTRESIMIIGKTTSADEFQNSYDHEKGHLCKQIAQKLYINPWGEETEYLAGAIGQKTFPIAKHFLCEHCRKSRLVS